MQMIKYRMLTADANADILASRVADDCVMITYNLYIVIRETGQFSSKGIINDFIGNLNRLTVSRRFTEQAV